MNAHFAPAQLNDNPSAQNADPYAVAISKDAREFWRRGFVILRGLFAPEEMGVLRQIATTHADISAHAAHALNVSAAQQPGQARPSFETLFVWNDTAGRDAFAKATRSHRVIDRLEAIFDDQIYVYHNKLTLKYPGVVGFMYHQDYGYWYDMGNLLPDMATAYIAVDRATRANGCLKLIEGSHRLGRLNHFRRNGFADTGVEPERLQQILARMPEVAIELEAGDAVIFHCNVLHSSDDNGSNESRIGLLGCYNTRRNDPYRSEFGHPGFQQQGKLRDRITENDIGNLPDFSYQWQPPG